MSNDLYEIRKNRFGRWCIVHPLHSGESGLAWSGARWVAHYKGIPISDTQVSSFESPADLHRYALENIDRIREATAGTIPESTNE